MTFYVIATVLLCVTLPTGAGLSWASAFEKDRARSRRLWKVTVALYAFAFAVAVARNIQAAAFWPEGGYPDGLQVIDLMIVPVVILFSVVSSLIVLVYSFARGFVEGARNAAKNSRRD